MASKKRIAVIDRERFENAQLAYEAVQACPEVRMGRNAIFLGKDGLPAIDEQLCTGCGLCVKKAPANAIKIVNLPAELDAPSFQYGANTFRLYGFVLPKEGGVVGVVGVNGIGKSTAIDLMRGHLAPNLGRFDKPPAFDEIKQSVRGQEIQGYLEKISKKKIALSHKMQDVNKLASSRATVKELLAATIKSRERAKAIAAEFNLGSLLERKTKQLSGGELQRLAVACCLGKDADVYCLDEPSSYLDVSERLKAAKSIRARSEEKPTVVIEHDLALLDYLSDYVHVLYGVRGAYGVVSQLKSSKSGVNEFLSGYLREENVRFRDYMIKFETASHSGGAKGKKAFVYPAVSKKFKGFKMAAEAGAVYESEIIGILGPNAVGKTTFIKILAGEIKPDGGACFDADGGKACFGRKSISYKPQYITPQFGGMVRDYFAADPDFDYGFYSSEVSLPLSIGELEERNVKELSGGELQRTEVALCLSRKADLYLLDEPSAFLDAEQRLRVASLLRRIVADSGKNAFVIDHDLVLVDSVSDRLIVFSGTPAVEGNAGPPVETRQGMNSFLRAFDITLPRRNDWKAARQQVRQPEGPGAEEGWRVLLRERMIWTVSCRQGRPMPIFKFDNRCMLSCAANFLPRRTAFLTWPGNYARKNLCPACSN